LVHHFRTPQKDLKPVLVNGANCGQDGRAPIYPGGRPSRSQKTCGQDGRAPDSTITVAWPRLPDASVMCPYAKKFCYFGRDAWRSCVRFLTAKARRCIVKVGRAVHCAPAALALAQPICLNLVFRALTSAATSSWFAGAGSMLLILEAAGRGLPALPRRSYRRSKFCVRWRGVHTILSCGHIAPVCTGCAYQCQW